MTGDKSELIEKLNELRAFLLQHNVIGWINKIDFSLNQLEPQNSNVKKILNHFIGSGMGSLLDLYIATENGHTLSKSQEQTNKELSELVDSLLRIRRES